MVYECATNRLPSSYGLYALRCRLPAASSSNSKPERAHYLHLQLSVPDIRPLRLQLSNLSPFDSKHFFQPLAFGFHIILGAALVKKASYNKNQAMCVIAGSRKRGVTVAYKRAACRSQRFRAEARCNNNNRQNLWESAQLLYPALRATRKCSRNWCRILHCH
jgi:hypothetical protein